ncbi:MAG: RNB domain-containing ribonuclease [Actinomycetia bacterium]|nr:RNB domain-containing ribonuclease [Actinomycetes bacterium]MCP3911184.1 RNB domain-containing ribonuclease [Actinomycetes bacterium]MCP4083480.1 RNB domain-containing ribonuclease [Actinomycetes bacterium]
MSSIRLTCAPAERFESGFRRIRSELGVPDGFPVPVETEARAAAAAWPPAHDERTDRRDINLVTIDPEGSQDLDQAFHAERRGSGYRVHYAIADLGVFVEPGGALDTEALTRGVTLYSPDERAGLHPTVINEDAASLLPGLDRPAVLWSLDLDQRGELTDVGLERAVVQSRAAESYQQVQADLDGDNPNPVHDLLREIGTLRQHREIDRGGVSLNLPCQEVTDHGDHYTLDYDVALPVEGWNAQISLLTGMTAAQLMIDGGVGLLRTLPPPDRSTLASLQKISRALEVRWPDGMSYAQWVRGLDPSIPGQAALLTQAARGLRGAGYVAFDGDRPDRLEHAAIASTYAHVTAPLRRVVDRFNNEILLAHAAGCRPAGWLMEALEELPSIMGRSRQKERALERSLVDFAEALVLQNRVGDQFDAVVTDIDEDDDEIRLQLLEPAVVTYMAGTGPALGDTIGVRLDGVDVKAHRVEFSAT